MATTQVDPARQEAFAGKMLEILNGGFLSLMTSLGHRTGVFDAMAGLPAATSSQIAEAAGLNERYVREWLGAMVTGGIVEYDPAAVAYRLPPEHGASLTRAAGPDNLATMAQYMTLFAPVEGELIECFRNGGGVPYSSYPGFSELMAEESGQVFDATLVDVTLPLVPGLVERLEGGIDALDVGCGSGHAVNLMAKAFPASRFAGYDFAEEGIAAARAEAVELGLANARFQAMDVAAIDEPEGYDLITAFDSIHDQARPRDVLAGISRALRPGGTFLMVDIAASSRLEENVDHPLGPALYTVSCMHCMTVSLAYGGEGLGAAWGEQKALELLAEAGFTQVDVKRVDGDVWNSYYVAAKA